MPIKAVVFDLDGLMFNTETIFNEVGHEILRRRGHLMTPLLIGQMMGRRSQDALQVMIDMHNLAETPEQLAAESWDLFFDLAADRLEAMPGLYELLDVIDRRQLPKGVATSSSRAYLERVLGQFDLLPRFPMTLTAEDVTHGKPHPEIYQTAAGRLRVDPSEMLVLEDSQAGTNAAAAAGAVIVSVPHEHSAHHDFSRATFIADSLADPRVLALLGE